MKCSVLIQVLSYVIPKNFWTWNLLMLCFKIEVYEFVKKCVSLIDLSICIECHISQHPRQKWENNFRWKFWVESNVTTIQTLVKVKKIRRDSEPYKDEHSRISVIAAALAGTCVAGGKAITAVKVASQEKYPFHSLSSHPLVSCCFPLAKPKWKPQASRAKVEQSVGSVPFTSLQMGIPWDKELREWKLGSEMKNSNN